MNKRKIKNINSSNCNIEFCDIKSPFTGGKVSIRTKEEEVVFRGEKLKILYKYYHCEDTGNNFTDSKLDDDMMWATFRAYCERKGVESFNDIVLKPQLNVIQNRSSNSTRKTERINYNVAKLVGKIDSIRTKHKRINKVRVIAYGRTMWWSEERVRAFQVLVHNASNEEFEELRKNVTIFSGMSVDCTRKMIIRKDGKFENEFEGGFYNGNANMAFEIL